MPRPPKSTRIKTNEKVPAEAVERWRLGQHTARQKFIDLVERDIERIYAALWDLIDNAERTDDSRVKMLSKLLDKFLPEQREVSQPDIGRTPPVLINIQGLRPDDNAINITESKTLDARPDTHKLQT